MPSLIRLLLGISLASAAAAQTGLFELHLGSTPGVPNAQEWVLLHPGGSTETVSLDATVQLDGAAVASADAGRGPDGLPQIRLVLTADGARKLLELTGRHVGRRFGIVVDGRLRAAPFVRAAIGDGVLEFGGISSYAEAEELARKLGPPARDAAALRDLRGSWSALSVTMNGRLDEDPKLAKSTWTFQDDVLAVTNGLGETERFTLARDPATPGALRLDPIAPSKERGGWMLFKREGDRLTLAFGDNLEGRPEGFEPAPKKLVMKLARAGRVPAAPAPCDILVAAGIRSLLPGGVRQTDVEQRTGLPACKFADAQGRDVVLMLAPAAGRAAFEAEVERMRKQPRQTVQDEPQLGQAAVSAVRGTRVLFAVLKGETLVGIGFQMPSADIAGLREFTRRVLAEVRD